MHHSSLLSSLLAAMLVLLTACENVLETPVEFSASIADEGGLTLTDGVYHVSQGTTVSFNFGGNADFISLSQQVFNESTPVLHFDTKVSWNNNSDNLALYLSTDFAGLSGNNPQADAELIQNHGWTDLGSLCNWPQARNDEQHTAIDLTDYRDRSVVLAFRYKTEDNAGFQPMFTISDLRFSNTIIKTGLPADSITASMMGLQPFDMLNLSPDTLPYRSSASQGVWDLSDYNSLVIRQSPASRPLNEDWLITRPLLIPRGQTVTLESVAIKNYYLEVDHFDYTFEETGELTLTFNAANANYKHHSTAQQVFRFVVSD